MRSGPWEVARSPYRHRAAPADRQQHIARPYGATSIRGAVCCRDPHL